MKASVVILLLSLCGFTSVRAQQRITINDAVEIAVKNNQQIAINQSEIRSAALNVRTANRLVCRK